MRRWFCRWFAPLLIALGLTNSEARAETPAANDSNQVNNQDRIPVMQYILVFLSLLAVLVILCMPTRKTQ